MYPKLSVRFYDASCIANKANICDPGPVIMPFTLNPIEAFDIYFLGTPNEHIFNEMEWSK